MLFWSFTMTDKYIEKPEIEYNRRLGKGGFGFFPTEVLEDSGLEARTVVPEMKAVRVVTDPNRPIKDSYLLNGRRVDADEVLKEWEKVQNSCPRY